MSSVSRFQVAGRHPSTRRLLGGRVRRWGLTTFFVSIAVNAALGVYAVVTPDFGETQSKILSTSLFVTGAILVALACEPAWERRFLGPVPYAGAVLGSIAFAMSAAGMWAEVDSDVYGKLVGTVFVAAAACTTASLLSLALLARGHRWVYAVALGLLTLGATMVAVAPWIGSDPPEPFLRAVGVVLVVFAAFAVTVPVLHWVDRSTVARDASTQVVRHCPYCGAIVSGPSGVELSCGSCAERFTVLSIRRSASGASQP